MSLKTLIRSGSVDKQDELWGAIIQSFRYPIIRATDMSVRAAVNTSVLWVVIDHSDAGQSAVEASFDTPK